MSKVTFSVKKGGLAGLASLLKPSAPKAQTPSANVSASSSALPATSSVALGASGTAAPLMTASASSAHASGSSSNDGPDELESFMAEINSTVEEQARKRARLADPAPQSDSALKPQSAANSEVKRVEAGGLDEGTDDAAAIYAAGVDDDGVEGDGSGDGDFVYDSDGEVIGVKRGGGRKGGPDETREAPPLPPVDHSKIRYEPFRRSFYAPSSAIAALSVADIAGIRAELGVRVEGTAAASLAPAQSFMQLGLDTSHPVFITTLSKAGYEAPTAIQAQALPALLSGRDVLGLAQTGSGKTLAYVLPLVRHAIEQRELASGDGPIGLILAPTRELATQIYGEAKRFSKPLGMKCALLTGGSSKWEQSKALRAGAELVVATPGRLIDHLSGSDRSTNLRRVTYLVLDEADRMLSMGFEKQVRCCWLRWCVC